MNELTYVDGKLVSDLAGLDDGNWHHVSITVSR